MKRCAWVPLERKNVQAYIAYHDTEWGVPSFDDIHLFEMLTLEGAQAGLSWSTILKKSTLIRPAVMNSFVCFFMRNLSFLLNIEHRITNYEVHAQSLD